MRVTVKIGQVEVTVDRPSFQDYKPGVAVNGDKWRINLLNDSILPTLKEAVEKAKELHSITKQ